MKKIKVSKNEMKHSSRGIFRYLNRKPIKMLKGGHGEKNIKYMQKHKLPYILKDEPDKNGVRHGSIPCHVRTKEHWPAGHVWFPQNWGDEKIAKAGEYVANLKRNSNIPDHTPMHGKYQGVHVVTYKSHGRICGICPNFEQKKDLLIKVKP